jgi:hypothetical protein
MSFSQAKVANDNRFQQRTPLFTLSPERRQGGVMGVCASSTARI